MIFHDMWKLCRIHIMESIKFHWNTAMITHSLTVSMGASVLLQQSWVVATETIWSVGWKIFTIWLFTEYVCWLLPFTNPWTLPSSVLRAQGLHATFWLAIQPHFSQPLLLPQAPELMFPGAKAYPSFFFPQLLMVQLTNKTCIYSRYTMWCFHIPIHHEMITTIKLMDISITSKNSYYFFLMCGENTRFTFVKLEVYNTESLTIVTMLYFRSPELIHPV